MVPDTSLRLSAIQKALEDIIRPTLPPGAEFAHQQLDLIVRSLALVRKQIPEEFAFRIHDARAFAAFGRAVVAALPATAETEAVGAAIEALDAVTPAGVPDRAAIEQRLLALRGVIERAVETGARDPAGLARLGPLVLAHTERQTVLERLWVVDTGFDPAPDTLPPLASLLYGPAATVPA